VDALEAGREVLDPAPRDDDLVRLGAAARADQRGEGQDRGAEQEEMNQRLAEETLHGSTACLHLPGVYQMGEV
jgi:hypothetical protein